MAVNVQHLYQSARKKALKLGLMRQETLLILALALVLATLSIFNLIWNPPMWWAWILLGLGGAALLVWSTLGDKSLLRGLVNKQIHEHADASSLRVPELQAGMVKALYQHRSISKMLLERKENLDMVMKSMDEWVLLVHDIVKSLDNILNNPKLISQSQQVLGEAEPTELMKDPITAVLNAAALVSHENSSHQLVLARDVIVKARNELSIALDQAITINAALRRAQSLKMDAAHVVQIESVLDVQLSVLSEAQDAVQHLSYTYARV
jgi:hypothetical protein